MSNSYTCTDMIQHDMNSINGDDLTESKFDPHPIWLWYYVEIYIKYKNNKIRKTKKKWGRK